MATLDILFSPFFFFTIFLISQIAATRCGGSSCYRSGPLIRFPFRLRHNQPQNCRYSVHFELSCDIYQHTILTLPSSEDFEVATINYNDQTMWINDLNWCMHKSFLDKNFSLVGTPFHFSDRLENYTYFKCPSKVGGIGPFAPISCLSEYNYNVIAVPSSSSRTVKPPPQSRCRAMSSALLPSESSELGEFFAIQLTWSVPDCTFCEATGRVCGLNVTSSQTECYSSPGGVSSRAAKNSIAIAVLILVGLVCIVGYAFYSSSTQLSAAVTITGRAHETNRRNDGRAHETNRRARLQELITQLSAPVTITGLDAQTIESYQKTQLGESLELPDPNDKTCSICLDDYQSKETLRTIPKCNHYFHVDCIDEWLRKKPTCPLCRNLPRTHEVSTLVRTT